MIKIKEIEKTNNITFVIYEINKQIFTKAYVGDVPNILQTLKGEHNVN